MDQLKSTRKEILNQPGSTQPIPALYDPQPASLRVIDPKQMEGLRLCLLTIDHTYGILQQLVPSDINLNHDHTYCCFDPEKMGNPPVSCG